MGYDGACANLSLDRCDANLKWPGLRSSLKLVDGGASVRCCHLDFGPHIPTERRARSLLRHSETDSRAIDGPSRFVGDFDDDTARASGRCGVNRAFAFQNADVEQQLRVRRLREDQKDQSERNSANQPLGFTASRTTVMLSGPPARFAASTRAWHLPSSGSSDARISAIVRLSTTPWSPSLHSRN